MSTARAGTIEVVVHSQSLAGGRAQLIELRPAGDSHLPPAEPGAHVDLHLGSLIRQYSLVDTATPDRYLICVQHETTGRGGSRYVHERLRVGDRLRVSAPRATFHLDDRPHHAILVAGGIGITPLLAMAGALHARGASYELHAYGHTADAVPLREYVAVQPYADRVLAHDAGESLRLGPPEWAVRARTGTVVYVCGPAGFTEAATAYSAGADKVRTERFLLDEPASLEGDAFTVVARSTGQRMTVEEGETIAEVLERHGYEVFLSCEQGICGSCLTGVLAGVPDHRDEVQTPAEHAANAQINLCVSRSRTPVLELDL